MKNMRSISIRTLIFSLIITIFSSTLVYNFFIKNTKEVNRINKYWSLNLPSPNKIKHIQLDFNLLGESGNYTIYKYSNRKFNKLLNLELGELVTAENIKKINNEISKFIQISKDLSLNYNQEINLIESKIGDRYLKCVDSTDDRDYIILIIKPTLKEIYLLEVNM